MNKEFTTYLESIGMTNPLIMRVETIYNFFHDVAYEEITDIFVCDFIEEDGSREYESVWFFSANFAMEAKGFISQDDFDMTPMGKRVKYWSVEKQDYDFIKATDKSRLHIKFSLLEMTSGDLKASKENCDNLKALFYKYLKPNIVS